MRFTDPAVSAGSLRSIYRVGPIVERSLLPGVATSSRYIRVRHIQLHTNPVPFTRLDGLPRTIGKKVLVAHR